MFRAIRPPGAAGPLPETPGQDAALRQSRYLNRVFSSPCAFQRRSVAGAAASPR